MTEEKEVGAILIVDDRRENLLSIRALLENPELSLLSASDGQAALDTARAEELALILLDVMMPGMDGFEVARRLKQDERTRGVPIIFLTAIATDIAQIHRAYSVGAVDYIIKPVDPDILRHKVAVFVELDRQRRLIARQAATLRRQEQREFALRLAELRHASDARYRKLVAGIDHVIAWTVELEDFRASFISRQAAALLGYAPERMTSPDFWQSCIHAEDRPRFLELFHRAADDGSDQYCDHRMLRADGAALWFHSGFSAERSNDGTVQLHGVSVDVTALKQATERALQAKQTREHLLAILSRDLREPLTAVTLDADALKETGTKSGLSEEVLKKVDRILHAAHQMERLLRDFTDIHRLEQSR